ncbi:MAG TPA: thiolase family protein, partial [Candidatus Dormibacteraeota bacterium]|nr:thiolase family protein [Candidatus Dormibacteraeota bacterium]
MRQPYITGVGMIGFGRFRDATLESLAVPAALDALSDAGAGASNIDAVYCGNVYGGMLPAQRIAGQLGLTGRPCYNVEAACSSSAVALHLAVQAIRAGQLDTALVIGVEQLSVFGGGTLRLNESDFEVSQGVSMPAVYAMRAQRYLGATGATIEDLAAVAVKNRGNGARNPRAQFRKAVTVDEVLASRPIADPLTLLQCCGSGDGAAAVVVSSDPDYGSAGRPVAIAASVVSSGTIGPHDLSREPLTARVAQAAYQEAGITPSEVNVVELHDAFSIAELLYYEALGLCGYGEAAELLRDGFTAHTGACPVNPSGGLLARGHPLGATGIAQVAEVVWHLRQSGALIRPQSRIGLTHCTGGG